MSNKNTIRFGVEYVPSAVGEVEVLVKNWGTPLFSKKAKYKETRFVSHVVRVPVSVYKLAWFTPPTSKENEIGNDLFCSLAGDAGIIQQTLAKRALSRGLVPTGETMELIESEDGDTGDYIAMYRLPCIEAKT